MLVVECQKETKITNCWCHDAMFKRKELYEFLCEKYKNQVDMSTDKGHNILLSSLPAHGLKPTGMIARCVP